MKNVDYFFHGQLPPNDMNIFVREINALIDTYNLEADKEQRKLILKQIQARIHESDCKYKPGDIAKSEGYHLARTNLYRQIKDQYASLGVPSLITSDEKSTPLSEIIANMIPPKADELFVILQGNNPCKRLSILYPPSEASDEAEIFRTFLKRHKITFLGGNNSRNFKVTPLSASDRIQVLKVDLRMNHPKSAEFHLQDQGFFAPVATERQVVTLAHGQRKAIGGTLLVTEFYANGSLYQYRRNNPKEALDKTADIFKQMAEIFLKIQNKACFFPDAKMENWLLDDRGQLFITDTKSFVFTEQGYYDKARSKKKGFDHLIRTQGLIFPEISEQLIDAEKSHAFLLGKNLYYYLINRDEFRDDHIYDFNRAVFQSIEGSLYRELIEKLVKFFPIERISVTTAWRQLALIKCVKELTALSFGADEQMAAYIAFKLDQFESARSRRAKEAIVQRLEAIIQTLKDDPDIKATRDIISDLRKRSGVFTTGINDQAKRIEEAMSMIPVEERINFLTKQEHADGVINALALKRGLLNVGANVAVKDIEQAKKTFKTFKQAYEDAHHTEEEQSEEESPSARPPK